MKATARYLADDAAGFSAAKARVLALNPKYSRMYNIIGEYADWEHRYEEIVQMMREALLIESDNAKARAQLGLNQIRAGDEAGGLLALQSAFKADPFNVRVFNTLNLYEKKIASEYVTVDQQRFKIRYHKDEKSILERYVPDLLDRAWSKMVKVYGFTPHTPTGIELYRDRESFSIRTSGLPHTAIQGVCFGKTLAAMSLGKEKFNLGMTLWHELAHVFHIQLSASHVPRWFTEGLAEYETLIARPEWTREYDAELYAAMRDGKLPVLASMSRAFTRAEQISDVAMAYYASSQIVVMLMERYGAPKVVKMLELWGKGKRHEQVFAEALGVSATELDRDFKAFLEQRFLRYKRQFVPLSRAGPLAQARADAKKAPRDASKHTIYALALMRARRVRQAARALDTALALDPKLPDANYLMAEVQLLRKNPASAKTILARLNSLGHDGFAVQMLLAEAAEAMEDKAGLRAALEAAHRFDPSKSEPINALAELAAEAKDAKGELEYLRKLALLEEHDGRSHRRLVRKLLDAGLLDEAMSAGEAALYADLSSLEGHVLFAEALIAKNQLGRAAYELESATLCEGKPGDIADAHARLAEILLKQGKRPAATVHAKRARELDPNNARVKSLPL
jgi:tetratricopeptide (TPR) repeat protein